MSSVLGAANIVSAGVQAGAAAADTADAAAKAVENVEIKKKGREIEQSQMVAAMADGISSDAKKAVERMAQS